MTYEQYWYGDVFLVYDFLKAEEYRAKQKDQDFWLQGMYIYEALCDVSPVLHAFAKKGTKPLPYSDKPYSEKKEQTQQKQEDQEEQDRLKARLYMSQMVQVGKNWGKKN